MLAISALISVSALGVYRPSPNRAVRLTNVVITALPFGRIQVFYGFHRLGTELVQGALILLVNSASSSSRSFKTRLIKSFLST